MTMAREFERVFGSYNEAADGGQGRIYADGWPDAFEYDADVALPVLATFPAGHGLTERGDAEVCEALDAAGARK